MSTTKNIDDIQFEKDIYPRDDYDKETVNKYRLNIDNLPAIDISKDGSFLIDGYHRIIAHRLEKKETIEANILDIPKEDILWEAAKKNSRHGKQLNPSRKRKLAQIFYDDGHKELDKIADVLAVSESSIEKWTRELRDKENDERDLQILDLYLQCKTQQEIADEIGKSQQMISNSIDNTKNQIFTENGKTAPESLQVENHWDFARCDNRYGTKDTLEEWQGKLLKIYFGTIQNLLILWKLRPGS